MNLGEGYKGAPGTSRTILYQPLKVTKKDSIKKKMKKKDTNGQEVFAIRMSGNRNVSRIY